jgi:hypothetical protein
MTDDQAARDQRAQRLRQKIDAVTGKQPAAPPESEPRQDESPREFTERKVREQLRHPPKKA